MKQLFRLACIAILFTSCSKGSKDDIAPPNPPDKPAPVWPTPAIKTGLNKDSVLVTYANGSKQVRYFLYYLPASLSTSKPISLLYYFHGSIPYTGADPMPVSLLEVQENHFLIPLADTANIIIAFPVGLATSGLTSWVDGDKNVAFTKEMMQFFKKAKPDMDNNRIYSCGHSSGAIFSYRLALTMSDVFAAVCPVSGQYSLPDSPESPARVVPIRCFNGMLDETVNYAAASKNIRNWADKIGGYFIKDSAKNVADIIIRDKKYTATPTLWQGGNGNIEFYGIQQSGHSINWALILPSLWDFLNNNPKQKDQGLYLGVQSDSIKYNAGNTYQLQVRSTKSAKLEIIHTPAGCTATLTGNTLNVVAGSQAQDGEIIIQATLGTHVKKQTIAFLKE